jgi:hypothetical protein
MQVAHAFQAEHNNLILLFDLCGHTDCLHACLRLNDHSQLCCMPVCMAQAMDSLMGLQPRSATLDDSLVTSC